MDDMGVYRMLKRLYECDSGQKSRGSLLDSKRHSKESRLGSVGKKQRVYSIIHRLSVLKLPVLALEAEKEDVFGSELEVIISDLKARGLIYEPEPGLVGCVGE